MKYPDIASRLSGECRAVAHYVRTGMTGHIVRDLEPNRYRPPKKGRANRWGYQRETPQERRERLKPRPRKLKNLPVPVQPAAPQNPHNYRDNARRPFGRRGGLPRGSAGKTMRQGLSLVGRSMMRRYRLPFDIINQIIAQGNVAPNGIADMGALQGAMQQAGWTLKCASNAPPSVAPWTPRTCVWASAASSMLDPPLCGTTLQVVHFQVSPTNVNINWDGYRTVVYGPGSTGTPNRMTMWQHYSRVPATGPRVRLRRGAILLPDEFEWPPQLDPMQLPIKQPMGTPAPIPYRVIPHRRMNPNRDPFEQSTGSQPRNFPQAQAQPGRAIPPGYIPVDEVVITPPPGPGKRPVASAPEPAWHSRRPPKRGKEKENKVGNVPAGLARAAISLVTESADVAEAFYYAIPDKERPYARTPWDKAVKVWENLDKVEIPALVGNLIIMLITDAAAGRWGQAQRDANRRLYDDFGIDLSGHLPKKYLQPEPDFEE